MINFNLFDHHTVFCKVAHHSGWVGGTWYLGDTYFGCDWSGRDFSGCDCSGWDLLWLRLSGCDWHFSWSENTLCVFCELCARIRQGLHNQLKQISPFNGYLVSQVCLTVCHWIYWSRPDVSCKLFSCVEYVHWRLYLTIVKEGGVKRQIDKSHRKE